jgi:serine protease inhibitor
MKAYNTDNFSGAAEFSAISKRGDNMNGTINNSKLFDRNFQNINNKKKSHNTNIDRLCMERDFEKGSFDGSDVSDSASNNMGEITGNSMKNDRINKGMPMRSQYNPKKPIYDANKYLDFDLYDKKPSQSKVGYNESNNYSSFADINSSMTPMTQQISPLYILNNSMEKFGSRMFEKIFQNLFQMQSSASSNNSFIICTLGLYSLFSSLYLVSDNTTENETKKFFDLPNKNILEESLFKLTKNLENMSNMINIKNLFVYGNNIPHREDILQSISPFATIACVNIKDPQRESIKLTYIINKLMGTTMRNPVTPLNIENLQIMFMTTAVIHPIWSTPFDGVGKGLFFGSENEKKQNYLISRGKVFPYFEDNEHQLLEIKCGDGNLMFGILLYKNEQIIQTNQNSRTNEKLHSYIEHIKLTALDEIRIPSFTQDLKFRFNNILKKMGLNTIFHKITSKDLFPEGDVKIHDIIQNVKIIIDDASYKEVDNSRGYHSIRKFIADRPFFYYFRATKTNTILVNGIYNNT